VKVGRSFAVEIGAQKEHSRKAAVRFASTPEVLDGLMPIEDLAVEARRVRQPNFQASD
jgi:hypothetical protein